VSTFSLRHYCDYFHSPDALFIPVRLYTVKCVKTANPGRALHVSPSFDIEQRASGFRANAPERNDKKTKTKLEKKDENGRK
jgi:hypothetical protein